MQASPPEWFEPVVHQAAHPLHEPDELVVEGLDLARLHAQDGVGVLADLRKRETAARLLLGISLLLLLGGDVFDLSRARAGQSSPMAAFTCRVQ